MKQHYPAILFFLLLILLQSCSYYNQVSYTTEAVRINPSSAIDSNMVNIIAPYKNALSAEMDEVIGYVESDMRRAKPEGALGNFICDVLIKEGREIYGKKIDFAVYNYGGLRIDALYEGRITRGKIYELLPFENFGVVLALDAKTTMTLLEKIIAEGGWPVGGITFIADGGKPSNIKIDGIPFDTLATYHVAMNDYMANGGDKLEFLIDKPADFYGATIRNIVLQYIEKQTAAGNGISAKIEGRITYAE
jgi:2',3'-cyclic-nucleotide 2'-phosphodiesterase (5'-nucleotidase family)